MALSHGQKGLTGAFCWLVVKYDILGVTALSIVAEMEQLTESL